MSSPDLRPGREPIPTQLQLTILRAKASGKTDQAAARACKISERTLRRELSALASAVGVGCRMELLVETVRCGWLDSEPDDLLAA
jgi:DNA-binding NarL/FixJ family response regulator